ncbi:MAG: manganese efflux pump [Oscillospiraceae bacterium]
MKTMLSSLLLVLSVLPDCFLASFAYGSSKIKIPFPCILVISLVGSGALFASLCASRLISTWIPPSVCRYLSFFLLLFLGISSLFQNGIKDYLRRRSQPQGQMTFHMGELRFILNVYLDETQADRDNSKTLNLPESLYLALALSVDSLAIGLSIGFSPTNLLETLLFALAGHIAAVLAGLFLGRRFSSRLNLQISWLSGAVLIVLALVRFLI